jgi:hypothetical protein
MEAKYYEPAGKEHYRLLEHLSHQFSNSTIIDIGTYTGLSAFALSTNPTNQVFSFDIELKSGLPTKPNIHYYTDNLMTPEGREKWKDVLLNAPFMFLDIDPHEGTREYAFYEWLRDNDYRGFVICDDIWYFGKMSENFWDKIPEEHKINATYQGHWSGTGILRLQPGKAEECLASFVNPDFNYGRSVLDMAIQWHPTCEVAKEIRSAFYHVLQLELGDGIENYLTDGTPAYSLRLLKTQELLYEAGKHARHVLMDGVPNSHAVFLLLLSNPNLMIDCLYDSLLVPPSLVYLNTKFGNRISFGRTRETYDLVHIDRSDPISRLDSSIAPGATIIIPHWNQHKKRLYEMISQGEILWVQSTPSVLQVKNRHDLLYKPETSLPSESNNLLPM